MKIAFDIDNTLTFLTEAVLDVYNSDSGDNLKVSDITKYNIENFVKPEYKEIFPRYFMDKRVWKKVKTVPQAISLIKKLYLEGHKVYFVTSTEAYNLYKKDGHMKRIFPEIDMSDALVRLKHKQLLDIDLLCDDFVGNLIGKTHYHKILLNKPWNQDIDDLKESINRCYNWDDVEKTIYKLIEEERELKRED